MTFRPSRQAVTEQMRSPVRRTLAITIARTPVNTCAADLVQELRHAFVQATLTTEELLQIQDHLECLNRLPGQQGLSA